MNRYTSFATVYDMFMDNIPYYDWLEYIKKIWSDNNSNPKLILDLACGTGNMSELLANNGYDIIGVDKSEDMLMEARQKLPQSLLLQQDMRELDLYGTVDSCICLCDSLNYILNMEDIEKVFALVTNFLNPKGLFIFDMNTEYKFKNILGNNTFSKIENDAICIWENSFDKEKNIIEYATNFFIREKDDLYKRHEEIHYEKAYDINMIKEKLETVGFKVLDIYNDLTFDKPNEKSERIFFVAQENLK